MASLGISMERLATLIVIASILIFGVYLVLKGTIGGEDVMFFVSSALGLYWIRSEFLSRDLKFDEKFLYYNQDTQILVSSITEVKLGLISNLQRERYWKIQYKIDGSVEKSITILPSLTNDNFAKFLEVVEAANPSVETDIFEFELLWGFIPKTMWRPRRK